MGHRLHVKDGMAQRTTRPSTSSHHCWIAPAEDEKVEVEHEACMMTSTEQLSRLRSHDHSVDLRARLDRAIDRALEDRRIVGTVVLVAQGGDVVYGRAARFADREGGRQMEESAIFLLSSVAKPIVTASALRLVEGGRMDLEDSVRRW